MILITRIDAQRNRLARYFTGKPCKYGHVAERYVTGGCVQCMAQRNVSESTKARKRHRYAEDRPRIRAKQKAYYSGRRAEYRARGHKARGMPAATRPMPERCECCGRLPPARCCLHLDHDHETGQFRGWLCHVCNPGLGMFGDSIEGLERAIAYLKRAQS